MSSVGLDIGSKTIKVVELERDGNVYELKASGIVGYVGDPIDKLSDIENFREVSQIIEKLVKAAGVGNRNVRVSLPEALVFTRVVRLPMLTDQEVAAAIKWEADQYIPIPIKEAIVQHQIIGRREKATPPEVVVLLVAAPRVLVEKYLQILQGAHLTVEVVETELISLSRALSLTDRTGLLMDFGARNLDLAISKSGALLFSRSIPTASDVLTRALSTSLGVTWAEAEQYKRTYGLSPTQLEGKIAKSLEPILIALADEIKKAIHFYQSEEKGDVPSSAIISGGAALLPNIVSYMTRALGIEVSLANPFLNMRVNEQVRKNLNAYAPFYPISVGLAMR